MTANPAWKKLTRCLQHDCCLICGDRVGEVGGNWDRFVPQAKGVSTRSARLGLYFWTHMKCNSKRGHALPTPADPRATATQGAA